MVKLTLSANAGGVLQLGEHRILVDALHQGKLAGFSTLNQQLRNAVFAHPDFADPELICVTHDHPDHCSMALIKQAQTLWQNAKLCLPEDKLQFTSDDLTLRYIPLTHDGANFENVPHYGIVITWRGKQILIPGDCSVGDERLLLAVEDLDIDLAILNFPWLTLRKGRECLQNQLKPVACVFWHLPSGEDDIHGYRKSAEVALQHQEGYLLYNPLQSIEIDI